MEIIPVIDLKGGVVVHARMGARDQYRPIVTPLSSTCDPVGVVRGILSVHPFAKLYVADLDAIQGRADNRVALSCVRAEFPHLMLWVDNGIADLDAAGRWLDAGCGCLVLGSETQTDGALVRRFGRDRRIVLSLDFRGDIFLGPPAILSEPGMWPQDVIVMTLARVGSAAGPDLDQLVSVRAAAPDRNVYAAGGVRGAADLGALKSAGVAGALVASCLHDGRLKGPDIGGF